MSDSDTDRGSGEPHYRPNVKKNPPILDSKITNETWKKEIVLWQKFTDLSKEKQGIAIHFSLRGKAREASIEISPDELGSETGVDILLKKLDEMFLVDKNRRAFMAYQEFERFKRNSSMTISEYINEFDRKYYQFKSHGMELPDAVLAFRLLESCNISDIHFQLAMSTAGDITFENMRKTLRKIFTQSLPGDESKIKEEPVLYNENRFNRGRGQSYRRPWNRQRVRGNSGNSSRGGNNVNPLGYDGKPSKCAICGSIYHWARNCKSHNQQQVSMAQGYEENHHVAQGYEGNFVEEINIVLMVNPTMHDEIEQEKLNRLCRESYFSAILDTGCSSTVCGEEWLECYMETLSDKDKANMVHEDTNTTFKFGDGKSFASLKRILLPCIIGNKKLLIRTDVVKCNVPLLLSKSAMKKAQMKINMVDDSVKIFGFDYKMELTTSGHYCIPIVKPFHEKEVYEILYSVSGGVQQMALKLHKQFAHPSVEKLLKLLRQANVCDGDLIEEIKKVSMSCQVCVKWKKPPHRPVVSMPMAASFNDVVAMDLKSWENCYFLVMVDLFTRYCSAVVINNKKPETVMNNFIKSWISVFGPPRKILTDNGGEFNNKIMREMGENFNIRVMCTAAEAPWSNGVCERLNAVLGNGVRKVMSDVGCSVDIALSWTVCARNCLQNSKGYTPSQLVFGFNPCFPNIMTSELPALYQECQYEIVMKQLKALHCAREEFIRMEANERIGRALAHQVRDSYKGEFTNGDSVYYKRNDSDAWHGPGIIIGRDGKQVLVRHGGVYVRAHTCRLQKDSTGKVDCNKINSDDKDENIDDVRNVEEDRNFRAVNIFDTGVDDELSNSDRTECNEHDIVDESENEQVLPAVKSLIGKRIEYDDEGQKRTGVIVSRAGKATGKNRFCVNIQSDIGGNYHWIDMSKVKNIRIIEENEEVLIVRESDEVKKAKETEIENWIHNDVYEEVQDVGQATVSVRWIISEKIVEGIPKIKARLVARGYEEDSSDIKTDSPTCCKEALRLALAVMVSKGWKCHTIDIKAAFLQGNKIERDVYLRPPVEFYNGTLWKLKKTVYGLNDAARAWYMRVKAELIRLGIKMCKLDPALFYWHCDGRIAGIICLHVDDFLWGGNEHFESVFANKLKSIFKIGVISEDLSFKYCGINIDQTEDCITVSQNDYISSMCQVHLPSKGTLDRSRLLNEDEKRSFRSIVGQLNWISTQSRPDISFDVSQLSSRFKNAKVEDIMKANKVVKRVMSNQYCVEFPSLGSLEHCTIECFSDASLGNLPCGGSQGGFVIFICGSNGKRSPIMWQSRKVRRVAKSTLAAEALALLDGCEAAIFLREIIVEMLGSVEHQCLPIDCFVDNKSLVDTIHSTNLVSDKYLRINIAAIFEMLEKGDIESVSWIDSQQQLADCLTKEGKHGLPLLRAIDAKQ